MWSPAALWSPVEVRAEVPAPPHQVFAVLADPHTYPEWLVGAQRIRRVDPAFPEPGSSFDHSVGASEDASVDDSSRALAAHPPHELVLEVHVGPLKGIVAFEVRPTGAGSEIVFRERPAGLARLVTPLTRPVLAARNRASLDKLVRVVRRGVVA